MKDNNSEKSHVCSTPSLHLLEITSLSLHSNITEYVPYIHLYYSGFHDQVSHTVEEPVDRKHPYKFLDIQ